jgi:4-hydroxy-4-methyl-2-oxoglutarate aldolase
MVDAGTSTADASGRWGDAAVASAWEALRAHALEEEGFACVLADAMGRTNAMGAEVRPMWVGARLLGRAVTARPAGTELAAVFDAIDLSEPGDVIVVEGAGSASVAFWGENTTLSARNRGAVGVVLGAPCRDVAAHARLGFPVFATGATPRAGVFGSRGETQVPVTVGGMVVRPSDAVLGDENGVVVVPSERLVAVMAAVPDALAKDRAIQRALAEGGTVGAYRRAHGA